MTKHEYNKKVGKAIRECREALGQAQDKFAINNDIDRGYYWKIEHGRINISVWQLYLLSTRLELLSIVVDEKISNPSFFSRGLFLEDSIFTKHTLNNPGDQLVST